MADMDHLDRWHLFIVSCTSLLTVVIMLRWRLDIFTMTGSDLFVNHHIGDTNCLLKSIRVSW